MRQNTIQNETTYNSPSLLFLFHRYFRSKTNRFWHQTRQENLCLLPENFCKILLPKTYVALIESSSRVSEVALSILQALTSVFHKPDNRHVSDRNRVAKGRKCRERGQNRIDTHTAADQDRVYIGLSYPYPCNIRLTEIDKALCSMTLEIDLRRFPISSERYRRFDSIWRYLATRQGAIVVSG